jgi:hypothetical protein
MGNKRFWMDTWLEDKPICIASLLIVNFHQPSHEFTFGVDMNFTSYPLVLTSLV